MKKYSIGKLPNNDIVYSAPTVSRLHADILVADDGSMTLTDHSKNGTYVNGVLVSNSSRPIRRGDNILFANTVPLDWSKIEGDRNNGGRGGNGGNVVPGSEAPKSTAALVLGILSLVVPFVGFILGIIGWVLAKSGLRYVQANGGNFAGTGKLKAGLICSMISVIVYIVVFAFYLILFFVALAAA